MLERLTEIKELLTPKPEPPTPQPAKKSFSEEFMDFLNKYGVIGLAIAFIRARFFTPFRAIVFNNLR